MNRSEKGSRHSSQAYISVYRFATHLEPEPSRLVVDSKYRRRTLAALTEVRNVFLIPAAGSLYSKIPADCRRESMALKIKAKEGAA